jgi:hypothetical protein
MATVEYTYNKYACYQLRRGQSYAGDYSYWSYNDLAVNYIARRCTGDFHVIGLLGMFGEYDDLQRTREESQVEMYPSLIVALILLEIHYNLVQVRLQRDLESRSLSRGKALSLRERAVGI